MIVKGIRQPKHVDSLVRQSAELITLDRREVEELRTENERLHRQRGDDFVSAARTAAHDKRVELLRHAIEVNPANLEAHFLLGESYISASDYPAAIRHLTDATNLDQSFGPAWRQLGVAQSRHGALDAAIKSVRRAVAVEPNDAEAHSVLGGIYRRKARRHYDSTGQYDMVTLQQARDAYAEAGKIDRWNTYPLMNVVRLNLQLAHDDDVKRREALDRAEKLIKFASYSADEEGDEDKWKWFDLADALAFTGKTDEALDAARQGLLKFEDPHRASAGLAAADPLQDILNSTPLPTDVESAVRALVATYRAAMG